MFQKKGWPALIQRVLEETHSGNYNVEDLTATTQQIVLREVQNFMTATQTKYKRQKRIREQESALWSPFRTTMASSVANQTSFAIKAPVAMLVLPILTSILRKIKFIHVVRE